MQNTEFFSSKDAKSLPFEVYQEAVHILADHYNSDETHILDDLEVTEQQTTGDDFKTLYASRNESGDVTFLVQGKTVKAHKCILLAHSLKMDEMLQDDQGHIIEIDAEKFPRLHEEAFYDMLRFFYYNQVTLELLNVCCLVEFSKEMELNKLSRCLEHNIEASPITLQSAPYLLEVAFTQLEENQEMKQKLKDRALSFVIEHMDEIDFQTFDTLHPIIGTTVLIGMQQIIQSNLIKKGTNPIGNDSIAKAPLATRVENFSSFGRTKSKKRHEQRSEKKNL